MKIIDVKYAECLCDCGRKYIAEAELIERGCITHCTGCSAIRAIEMVDLTPKPKKKLNGMVKHTLPIGENNPNAKLDEGEVKKIRRLYAQKDYSVSLLAALFKITKVTVRSIVNRKSWKHVV